MSRPHQPDALVHERHETSRRQARAADPSVSAWVSANAGTGKTHVLTTRVLRLLVSVGVFSPRSRPSGTFTSSG